MKTVVRLFIFCYGLGSFLLPLKVLGQIGTNPVNPTNNNAFGDNVKPKFKSDSGVVKKIYTSKSVHMISIHDIMGDSLVLRKIDTNIQDKERYSPLFPYDNYHINLGGLGLSQKELIPEFGMETGFQNGQSALSLYILNPEDIHYYRSKSPFTELSFLTGGKREQWFSLIHNQNINPRLNIGLQYYRVGSKGFYPRQVVDDLNLAFFSWYQSRDYRYNLVTSMVFNSLNEQINGGVANDTLFTVNNSISHDYEPVNLGAASTTWNQFDFYMNHVYNLGHIDSVRDKEFRSMKIYPLIQAHYTLDYKLQKYNFDDALDTTGQKIFYPNTFFNKQFTHDSIHQRTLNNEFGLSFFGHGNLKKEGHFSVSGIHINASIKDQLIRYQQDGVLDTSINNILIRADASYNLSDRFQLAFKEDYDLIGANHGDYLIKLSGFLNLGRSIGRLRGYISRENHQPDFIFDHYSSNSYRWVFHFNKEQVQKIGGEYENIRFRLRAGLELNLVDNYTYFAGASNQLVFPNQFLNQIRIVRFKVDKTFHIKPFGLQLYGVYQKNNEPLIVRTPEFYAFGSLFYENTFFKVLRIRAGVEGTFFNSTYLYDYAPGLQSFYVYSSAQTGNIPVSNIFLVAGLKRVKITLKYDYVNQNLPILGYYSVHNYPAPDQVFKMGVSWKFYD